jgi:hypothetical protein
MISYINDGNSAGLRLTRRRVVDFCRVTATL